MAELVSTHLPLGDIWLHQPCSESGPNLLPEVSGGTHPATVETGNGKRLKFFRAHLAIEKVESYLLFLSNSETLLPVLL